MYTLIRASLLGFSSKKLEEEYMRHLDMNVSRVYRLRAMCMMAIGFAALLGKHPSEWRLIAVLSLPSIVAVISHSLSSGKSKAATCFLLLYTLLAPSALFVFGLAYGLLEGTPVTPVATILLQQTMRPMSQTGLAVTFFSVGLPSFGHPMPFYQYMPLRLAFELAQLLALSSLDAPAAWRRCLFRLLLAAAASLLSDLSQRQPLLHPKVPPKAKQLKGDPPEKPSASEVPVLRFAPPPKHVYSPPLKRVRIVCKVPEEEIHRLPSSMDLSQAQSLLAQRYPSLIIHRLSLRPGCVIVQLDLVQGTGNDVDAGDEQILVASAAEWLAASRAPASEWLQVVQAALGPALKGQCVSVKAFGRSALCTYNETQAAWVVTEESAEAAAPPLSLEQPRCVALPGRGEKLTLKLELPPGGQSGSDGQLGAVGELAFWSAGVIEVVMSGVVVPARLASSPPHLELDLPQPQPGLLSVNVWSRGTPSCLLATQHVLVLPADCSAAAAEISAALVSASEGRSLDDNLEELLYDLGTLLETSCLVPLGKEEQQQQQQQHWHRHHQQQQQLLDRCQRELLGEALCQWADSAHCSELEALVQQLLQQPDLDSVPQAAGRALRSNRLEEDACCSHSSKAASSCDRAAYVAPGSQREESTKPLLLLAWYMILAARVVFTCVAAVVSGKGYENAVSSFLLGYPYLLLVWSSRERRHHGSSTEEVEEDARRHPSQAATRPGPRASIIAALVSWLQDGNVGVLLHLNRLAVAVAFGTGLLPAPQAASALQGASWPWSWAMLLSSSLVYQAMEAYDPRALFLIIPLQLLSSFLSVRRLGMLHALEYSLCLSAASLALHLGLARRRSATKRSKQKLQ